MSHKQMCFRSNLPFDEFISILLKAEKFKKQLESNGLTTLVERLSNREYFLEEGKNAVSLDTHRELMQCSLFSLGTLYQEAQNVLQPKVNRRQNPQADEINFPT